MIPRRLFYYWEGGPMPWLRLQTLQTFARHHPGWEIVPLRPIQRDLPLDVKSDIARWRALYNHGGWFVDTDVIFMARIPTELQHARVALTVDGGTQAEGGRAAFAIGLVGSEAGSGTMWRFRESCLDVTPEVAEADHQVAGTRMIARLWRGMPGRSEITNIPAAGLYPFGFRQVDLAQAWDPGVCLPEDAWALHWSGGHRLSRAMALEWGQQDLWRGPTPVSQALRRAYAA